METNKQPAQEMISLDTAIKYAQVAVFALQHSHSNIDSNSIKKEIQMLHRKFGSDGINIFMKERKQK